MSNISLKNSLNSQALSDGDPSGNVIQLENVHKTYLLGVEGVPALRFVSLMRETAPATITNHHSPLSLLRSPQWGFYWFKTQLLSSEVFQ